MEVITSHSGKIGWRPTDGGRRGLADTNPPGLSDDRREVRRKRVKMYEIKSGRQGNL